MRYTGPRGKAFSGDKAKAQSLQRAADLLVGSVIQRLKAPPLNGRGHLVDRKRLDDGSWIGCMVNMVGMQPIIRTWIESPITPALETLPEVSIITNEHGWFSIAPTSFTPGNTPVGDDGLTRKFYLAYPGPGAGIDLDRANQFQYTGYYEVWSWPRSLLRQRGSMYSGEMRKVVQLLQGMNQEIPYYYGIDGTCGIFRVPGKNPHVIRIGTDGCTTWPLATQTISSGLKSRLSKETGIDYLPYPVPTLPDVANRTVLIDSAGMELCYPPLWGYICSSSGWAFSASGAEAQAIISFPAGNANNDYKMGRYKIAFTADEDGTPVSAVLTKEEDGWMFIPSLLHQILVPENVGCVYGWTQPIYMSESERPVDEDIEFPFFVFYSGETPQVYKYKNRPLEVYNESGEVDPPCGTDSLGVCFCPDSAGDYRVGVDFFTYRGANIVGPGISWANSNRNNMTSLFRGETETHSFDITGSKRIAPASGGSSDSSEYIFEGEIGRAVREVTFDGDESYGYNFTFGFPAYEREAFYFFERVRESVGDATYLRNEKSFGGRIVHTPVYNWLRGPAPESGVDCFKSIAEYGGLSCATTVNDCYTDMQIAVTSFIEVGEKRIEIDDLGREWWVFPVAGEWDRPEATSTSVVTAQGREVNDARFVFVYSDGVSLKSIDLPYNGEDFEYPWMNLWSCDTITPKVMMSWLDVFTHNGFISTRRELDGAEFPKTIIGDLGKYQNLLHPDTFTAFSPLPYAGAPVSGWLGIPFLSENLARAISA